MIRLKLFPLLVFVFCLLSGCDQEKPAAAPPPPPKITVAHPLVRDVNHWDEYTGKLAAVETVDVKAQVSGAIDSVTFTEGAIVKKGDVLVTIDSRIFRAQLDSAKAVLEEDRAKLEQSKAVLTLSKNDLQREQEAASRGVASSSEVEAQAAKVAENEADIAENQADIANAEAEVDIAQLNVDWCKVTAPIDGRISSKDLTPGNMITGGTGAGTHLTTITSVNPIYCDVDADEASVLRYQKLAREKKRTSAADEPIACYMGLDNEIGFPHQGIIDFVDTHIDPNTGTRRARGVFPNPDGNLIPGFDARLRVLGQNYPHALLVIDDAIGADQDRKYIWVLGPDNKVNRRIVDTGPLEGELRVITSNLKPDDLVVVNGTAKLMFPESVADPTTAPMPEYRLPAAAATAAAAAAVADSATAPAAATAPATRGGGAP